MSFQLTLEEANQVFDTLRQGYRIYAPKRLKNAGCYYNTDLIRCQEIHSMEEIEQEQRSDYLPKGVFYPINQTFLHFTEHYFLENQADEKNLLIFARSCDIYGIKRLGKILLENGPQPGSYYKRVWDKVHFILMECPENGWESCACCSMETNVTGEYDLAMRPPEDEGRVLVECRSEQLARLFSAFEHAEFQSKFVRENKTTVQVPDIREDMVNSTHTLDMWKDYQSRCIDCGACNSVCITCSCFNTVDMPYTENGKSGERRRTWMGCMNDDLTTVNGGHAFRDEYKDRTCSKTMHKVYDFKKRFATDYQMCVGCGRCDDICPSYTSLTHIIQRPHDEVEHMKEEKWYE